MQFNIYTRFNDIKKTVSRHTSKVHFLCAYNYSVHNVLRVSQNISDVLTLTKKFHGFGTTNSPGKTALT